MPDPVGATTSVLSPRAIDSHAPSWAAVGAWKAPANHCLVTWLKWSSELTSTYCLAPLTENVLAERPVIEVGS
ncbi:hypothetical protein GCM10010176_067310 [Nonomuraea spiralis]|nr:hypothetical protein GCM10010176_067310 [Nonomuraea spiralis]